MATATGQHASAATNGGQAGRMAGVDCVRLAAVCAVIVLHTRPFAGSAWEAADWRLIVADQGARFGVPFFFVVAGYFWKKNTAAPGALDARSRATLLRLLGVYVFWSLLYLFEPPERQFPRKAGPAALVQVPLLRLESFLGAPSNLLLLAGVKDHLWFLGALAWALAIAWGLARLRRQSLLLPAGALLYLAGLLLGPYAGLFPGHEGTLAIRNGPFFGTLCFAAGAWLAGRNRPARVSTALAVTAAGLGLQAGESWLLARTTGLSPMHYDYLGGTLAYGLGAAMLALALPASGKGMAMLAAWGSYTLGVYALHPLVIRVLRPLGRNLQHWGWEVSFPFLACGATLLCVMTMARHPRLRRFVV